MRLQIVLTFRPKSLDIFKSVVQVIDRFRKDSDITGVMLQKISLDECVRATGGKREGERGEEVIRVLERKINLPHYWISWLRCVPLTCLSPDFIPNDKLGFSKFKLALKRHGFLPLQARGKFKRELSKLSCAVTSLLR